MTLRAPFIASYNMSCYRVVDVCCVHFLREVIKCYTVDDYVVVVVVVVVAAVTLQDFLYVRGAQSGNTIE